MKRIGIIFGIAVFLLLAMTQSQASASIVYLINPSDDGTIYSNGTVANYAYLLPSGSMRGVAEFPMPSIPATYYIDQAILSVNPYGLPLWDKTVDVFGYESYDGILTSADYGAGKSLGIWTLPTSLGFGQDAFFDVTDFVSSVKSPYVGFNLRTDGVDVFSSLEYNYGHPAQLKVSAVPEPASMLLFALGGAGMAFIRKRRKA